MRGHSQSVFFLTFILSSIYLLSYLTSMDRSAAKVTTDSQVSATTNLTDQLVQQKNQLSNQSAILQNIKNLISEEVQLLKSAGQRISKSTTQSSFSALGVFLLGLSLVIYGLRLTIKAMERRTSMYFKAMTWALVIPVIVIIVVYQLGLLLGTSFLTLTGVSDEPFFLISLVLLIPTAIVLFLLIAERRLVGRASQHHQGQQ